MLADAPLLRRGVNLEYATLGWNFIGSAVVLYAAITARSVALIGFGLDTVIEIVASLVVIWELTGRDHSRERRALQVVGVAFVLLAIYIAIQSLYVLLTATKPEQSALGIAWLAFTAAVMFALALAKARTGAALGNRVLQTEARVTALDGALAVAVLAGLILNAALGWWWADPAAALFIVAFGIAEGRAALAAR